MKQGLVYPRLQLIRHVSASIAAGVAAAMHASGRATLPMPSNMYEHCQRMMYNPTYDFDFE